MVVPLLTIDHTALLGISTPGVPGVGLQHFFQRLMDLVDSDGKRLFKVHTIELICVACKKLPAIQAAGCVHMKHRLPPWKTAATQSRVDLIMAEDPVTHARENMGIVFDDNKYAFSRTLIKAFSDRDRFVFTTHPSEVHIAIDPSGGGSASDYAVVSLVYDCGKRVVSPYSLVYHMRTVSTTSNMVLNKIVVAFVVVFPNLSRPIVNPSRTPTR